LKILRGNQKLTDISVLGFAMLIIVIIGSRLSPLDAFAVTGTETSSESVNKKLQITSDKLVSNQNELYITFTGHVKAIHGLTTVNSDHLRIFYTKGGGRQNITR